VRWCSVGTDVPSFKLVGDYILAAAGAAAAGGKRMVHWTADGPTRAGSRLTMGCCHWLCNDSHYEEVEVAIADGGSNEFDVRNIRERRKALTAFTIFHLVAVD
jgi:hypothetical protein